MKKPYNKKVSHYNANPFEKPDKKPRKKDRAVIMSPVFAAPYGVGEPGIVTVDSIVPSEDVHAKAATMALAEEEKAKLYEILGNYDFEAVHDSILVAPKLKKPASEQIKAAALSLKELAEKTGSIVMLKPQAPKTFSIPMKADVHFDLKYGSGSKKFAVGDTLTVNGQPMTITDVKDDVTPDPLAFNEESFKSYVKTDALSYYQKYMLQQMDMMGAYVWRKPEKPLEEKADAFLDEPDNRTVPTKELLVSFARKQLDAQREQHRDVERRWEREANQYRHAYYERVAEMRQMSARLAELEAQLERKDAQRSTIVASAIMETSRTRLFRE